MTKTAKKPTPKSTAKKAPKNRLATDKPAKRSAKIDWTKLEREKSAEQDALLFEYNEARRAMADLKDEFKHAKEIAAGLLSRLLAVATDLRDIRRGEYQPTLFDAPPAAETKAESNGQANGHKESDTATVTFDANGKPIDLAANSPISALCDFGLTKSKAELVKEAIGGATIGDLEKYQREHAHDWRQKIKGLGEQGGDKLIDAQVAFRKKFPMPDAVLTGSEKAKYAAPVKPEQAEAEAK